MPKNEKLKIIKESIVRGGRVRECPFGLPVTEACANAGDAVYRMAPLETLSDAERDRVNKANKVVYAHHKNGKKCPFADRILDDVNKVDCDFGDTGQGQPSLPYEGSPLYPHTFRGIGLDGLHGFPLGFYSDNHESRNLFFGLFSYLGYDEKEHLVKLANSYDEMGESEKADVIDLILEKLQNIKVGR